jgi:hypothetical protein
MAAIGRNGWTASTLASLALLALGAHTACSGQATDPGSTIENTNKATGGAATSSAGMSPATGGVPLGSGGLDLVPTAGTTSEATSGSGGMGGGCAATFVQAKAKTLAMFIMLDQSGSMREQVDAMTTRWEAVTKAFASFVTNPEVADFPVGLQYFGLPPGAGGNPGVGGTGGNGGTGGGGGSGGRVGGGGGVAVGGRGGFGGPPVSCVVADYAKAEVAIQPLAMNSKAIIDSMAAHAPATSTPTLPALEGGIEFVAKYASEHPDYKVVLVLATDGEPSGCDSTVENVTMMAAKGLSGTPSVQTYVIGVGQNLMNLNAIAAAGGTDHAYLVSDGNVQQDLLMALKAIQGTEVPCQYSVPVPTTGKALDFGKVNVQYTPNTGAPQVLEKVDSKAECGETKKFWYYDDNVAPTQILLCDDTCDRLTTVGDGKVEIVLDCKETIKKPPN